MILWSMQLGCVCSPIVWSVRLHPIPWWFIIIKKNKVFCQLPVDENKNEELKENKKERTSTEKEGIQKQNYNL